MRLFFEQDSFSFYGNSTIYNEDGSVAYTTEGKFGWTRSYFVYDASGNEVGFIKKSVWSFMPKFEIFIRGAYVGCIRKESTFSFKSHYVMDYNGWTVDGNASEINYTLHNANGTEVAKVMKDPYKFVDKYALLIDESAGVPDPVTVLMFVIAIDIEKASRSS